MNVTLRTIHELKSTHGDFLDHEISREDLETILGAAVRAATASGRQTYSIIVVEDKAAMKGAAGYTGSKMLVFCVDFNRLAATADRMGYAYEPGGLVDFMTGSTDTILAAQTAAIAARSLGIDSLFTNGIHRGDMGRLWRLLDLPERNCFPLIALVLGYARVSEGHRKGRLCGPGVIHWGKYHRPSPEELDAIVAEYDVLGLDREWTKKGFAHYLDWFYSQWVRCPKKPVNASATPPWTQASARMEEYLRCAGFLSDGGQPSGKP